MLDPASWLFGQETKHNILLRPAEAAQVLGISRSLAYELIRSGQLPAIRIGGRLRVAESDLQRFVQELRREAGLRGDGETQP